MPSGLKKNPGTRGVNNHTRSKVEARYDLVIKFHWSHVKPMVVPPFQIFYPSSA